MPLVALLAAVNVRAEAAEGSPHPRCAVVFPPLQSAILRPETLSAQQPTAFRQALSLAGLVVTGVGAGADGLSSLADLNEDLYWRDLGEHFSEHRFEFDDATRNMIAALDSGADWSNARTVERHFRSPQSVSMSRSLLANRLFRDPDFGCVLFLEFTYFLTPELNQVRMVVQAAGYTPNTTPSSESSNVFSEAKVDSKMPNEAFVVTFEYFSRSQGLLLRPWKEGEKQALIAAIEERYETKLARYPHNKKAYKKDRKAALSILKNREIILAPTAMKEGWPDATLAEALEQAVTRMTPVIRSHLKYFSIPEELDLEMIEFDYINWRGESTKLRGGVINERDGRVIYQDEGGNVYSMPRA